MSYSTTGEGNTVLVVDDDADIGELYSLWLERRFTVTTVRTGDGAIDTLDDEFDVVLLDRELPKWSASELLAEFRERGWDHPVVMISGVEPDTDIFDLPIDEYLVKPVSEDELRDAVSVVLEVSSYDELIREYYSLISKRSALRNSEVTLDAPVRDVCPELENRISSLENRLEAARGTFDEEQYRRIFRRFSNETPA